ncbi:hypothetical protein PJL18_04163 [Paenarthrobacter nicotinovorans]|nr:hypothetical protein [Paenarthrobacter nicotinovorans]
MAQNGGVEIGAAKGFNAVGTAQEFEAASARLAQDRGIERSAAKVIHGDGAAVLHAGLGGVVQGGGNWFADQGDIVQARNVQRGEDRRGTVRAPRCGVRHDDRRRQAPLPLFGPVHHPSGHGGVHVLGRHPALTHSEWNGVAYTALEFPDHPPGIVQAPAFSRLAHQYPAVVRVEKHRRHSASMDPEGQDFRRGCGAPPRLDKSCGGVTCPDINGENIAHGYLESSHGTTQASCFTSGS